MLSDLRFALRSLAKSPDFTVVAVLTFALAIGANTTIFTVLDGVLLRPLPYPEPQQLVVLRWQPRGREPIALTGAQFAFVRANATMFQAVAGYRDTADFEWQAENRSYRAGALRVSANFFDMLGVRPSLGRAFAGADERPDTPKSVILSDGLWRSGFGAERSIIGRGLAAREGAHAVAAILPPAFTFRGGVDVFLPLKTEGEIAERGANLTVLARLAPGVSLREAQAGLQVLAARFRKADDTGRDVDGIAVVPFQQWLAGNFRPALRLLFGGVGLLLLVAGANIAGLLIARTATREREMAIRLALGAGRAHLARWFLAESMLLALAGGAAGLLIAAWLTDAMLTLLPWNLPATATIRLDGRVLLFTAALTVGGGVALGLVSFARTLRLSLRSSLQQNASAAAGVARQRLRRGLVTGELAIATMLLIGAGLMMKSLHRLQAERLGFETDNVFTVRTHFSSAQPPTTAVRWETQQRVLDRLRLLPGVRVAAVATTLPLRGQNNLPTQREGRPDASIGGMEYRAVSPDYFAALGIPLPRGRTFAAGDARGAPAVAIVSESVARRWWPAENPLGDRVVVGLLRGEPFPDLLEAPRTVIGVAGDVKGPELGQPAPPTLYVPIAQMRDGLDYSPAWIVRTSGPRPADFATQLRSAITQADATQTVDRVVPMADYASRGVAQPRFTAWLMTLFAGLALVACMVGLYGLVAYFVAQRRREFAIRVALGARNADVLTLVLREGALLAALGTGLGLAGALGASRLLASLLFEVSTADPAVFAIGAAVLFAVALLACYAPARRATRVNPVEALRAE